MVRQASIAVVVLLAGCDAGDPSEQADDPRPGPQELASPHEECGKLSVADCKQREGCRVNVGRRVDEARKCIGESLELGCLATTGVCGDALPAARDAQGQAWVFDNTCVPPSLTGRVDPRVFQSWSGWPTCD